MDIPNFDCIPYEELRQWYFANLSNPQIPGLLKLYAENKLCAMRNREKGNIDLALTFESKCDEIYDKLPQELKW